MDKKLSIICAVAVVLIVAGLMLIVANPFDNSSSEESLPYTLKTQDFKLFKIDIPEGSNFTLKNEGDGLKYYQNNGSYSGNVSGIIINKGLTEDLIGVNSVSVFNSSSEQIYSFELKNQTVYKYVSNQSDVDIILIGEDLNLLKEMINTIKVKDDIDI